jgi:hypothetical protein
MLFVIMSFNYCYIDEKINSIDDLLSCHTVLFLYNFKAVAKIIDFIRLINFNFYAYSILFKIQKYSLLKFIN